MRRYKRNDFLRYTETNESLDSIVSGLDIKPQDKILAICGSGDQPLAILEKASKVIGIDTEKEQLNYTLARIRLIEEGKLSLFRNPDMFAATNLVDYALNAILHKRYENKYFTDERLNTIKLHINKIELCLGNIYDFKDHPSWDGEKFDSIYLSNSLGFDCYKSNNECMEALLPILKDDGIIYIAHIINIEYGEKSRAKMYEHIYKDERLSKIAQEKATCWNPGVYRKIAK